MTTTTWQTARVKSLRYQCAVLAAELADVEQSARPASVKRIMARAVTRAILETEAQIDVILNGA